MKQKKENRLSETSWFPHDTDAISDIKMAALLDDYGAEGYGIFWHLSELLHAEKTGKLPAGPVIVKAIARNMKVKADLVQKLIDSCVQEYKLLSLDSEGFLSSERVQRNILARTESHNLRVEAGRKGGQAKAQKDKQGRSNAKADLKQTHSNGLATPSTVQYSTVHPSKEGVSVQDDLSGFVISADATAEALGSLVSAWPFATPEDKKIAEAIISEFEPERLKLFAAELEQYGGNVARVAYEIQFGEYGEDLIKYLQDLKTAEL